MFVLGYVYTSADMLSKWCHHVRQQRAPVSFTQRSRFTKRTMSALERLGRQATF